MHPAGPEIQEAAARPHFPHRGSPQRSNRAPLFPKGIDRPSRLDPSNLPARWTTRRTYISLVAIARAPRDLTSVGRSRRRRPSGETICPHAKARRSIFAFLQSLSGHIPRRVFRRAARCASRNGCRSNGLRSALGQPAPVRPAPRAFRQRRRTWFESAARIKRQARAR